MTERTAAPAARTGGVSHWWSALGGPPLRRPALPGPLEADVAVVGAGYTGLWTAWQLKCAEPGLRVVVLEREWAGFGASGRNGGWLSGRLAGSRERWAAGHGRAAAAELGREVSRSVDHVARWCAEHGVDCDLVKGGSLTVATSVPALRRLQLQLATERAWGVGEDVVDGLTSAELAERVRVRGALGALLWRDVARLDPVKLLLGLARACDTAGVELYEDTPVTAVRPGVAVTPRGEVRAGWVVRATEGYTPGLAGLRRAVVPMNSAMVVTEPLGAGRWARIGWEGAETLSDGRHAYCYLQRTADGRIAIGGRGVPYRLGSRTDRAGEVATVTIRQLRGRLNALFEGLGGVGLDGAWAGVLGVPRDWSPSVGADPATGMAWAGGYVGNGVAAAHLAGRTLCDLVLGRDTPITRLPWVGHLARPWEPEPLRWLGIHGVYALYRRADRAEARTQRPSRLAAVASRVAGR